MTTASWLQAAACAGLPLSESDALFFGESWPERKQGIRVCESCPVRVDCLAFARRNETTTQHAGMAGTYGGLTVAQRVKLRRDMAAK